MGAVYFLTMRQLTGRWRLVIMAVLASLPVLITIMISGTITTPRSTISRTRYWAPAHGRHGALAPLLGSGRGLW